MTGARLSRRDYRDRLLRTASCACQREPIVVVIPTPKARTADNEGQFFDHPMSFWQPRAKLQLSHEDARQMVGNVSGFFRVLNEWATHEAGQLEDGSGGGA